MSSKNLFVVFEDFSQVHRNKDVGAIPVGMQVLGFHPTVIADTYKSTEFRVIQPQRWLWLPGALGRIGSIAALRGRCLRGDVVNLYHLSTKTLLQSLAIRLILPAGVVIWVKLDMNTSERSLRVASLVARAIRPRNLKEFAIQIAGRAICAVVDVISAESTICYRYVAHWPARKIIHFPNGVFRHEFGGDLPKREKVICCIARHGDRNKRSEYLLTSFCQLNLPDWKLELIGPFTDGFRSQYEGIIRSNPGLAQRITLFGNLTKRETVLKRLVRSKVFVLLSMYEGFSLALLEAAACGCLCVATDVGGAADVLKGGGILLPKDFSPEQLFDALQRATNDDHVDHSAISENTIARFNWNELLRDFVPNLN